MIVAVPAVVPPVTLPDASTVAISVLLLLHVPPLAASASVIIAPAHTADGPVIAGGGVFTDISVLAVQPEPIAYTAVAVPPDTPLNTPVSGSIVAIEVGVTLHIPPVSASVNVIVVPGTRHTDDGPPIGGGTGFTVTTAVAGQPVPALIEMIVAVP